MTTDNRPKVGLAVIIKKENKILLGQRKGSHGEGTWAMPGGHLEYGESWEECATREVSEEVGITISNIQYLSATNDIFQEPNKHYVTIFMTADYKSGEVQNLEPEKCAGWGWFEWDKMPSPIMLPIINLIQQNNKK
jgi:8-oxo-dGTP diphosphatase